MKIIQLVHSAREDIINALHYYQKTGVGEKKFQELLTIRIEEIASFPSGLLPIKPDITSSPLSTKRKEQNSFPYQIYYSCSNLILIVKNTLASLSSYQTVYPLYIRPITM